MLNVTEVKKTVKIVLICLSIIISSAMENKINENFVNNNKKNSKEVDIEKIDAKISETIGKLLEDFSINKKCNRSYHDELSDIVKSLNNLKYSHNYKFYELEGIEELKNIYHVLCENILKLSFFSITDSEYRESFVTTFIVTKLIEREKIIAKQNHFLTDFYYYDYLSQYIQLKVTNLLYDFFRDLNECYHKYFKNVTDFLIDFVTDRTSDYEYTIQERLNNLFKKLKKDNNYSDNKIKFYSPQIEQSSGFTKIISDKNHNYVTVICLRHLIEKDDYHKCHKFRYLQSRYEKKLDNYILDTIINFISSCSHEYIHNISNKAFFLNNLFNGNMSLKIHNVYDDIISKEKIKLSGDIVNLTKYNDFCKDLNFILNNRNKIESIDENSFSRPYMLFRDSDDIFLYPEFFTVNMEFFVKNDIFFNTYGFYIFNNEIKKVIDIFTYFSGKINKKEKKIEEKNEKESDNHIKFNKFHLQKNKDEYFLNYCSSTERLNNFINNYCKEMNFELNKHKIMDIENIINIDFITCRKKNKKAFDLFISYDFDFSKYLENYMKKSFNYSYKITLDIDSKKIYVITNGILSWLDNKEFPHLLFSRNNKIQNLNIETIGVPKNCKRDLSYLFSNCEFKNIDLSKFNFSCINKMKYFFYNCKNLESVKFPAGTFEIEDLTSMFEGCSNLKCIDFKNIYIKKIKKINSIFKNCDSLEKILHIKNLDTQKVEDISSMFYNCKNLKSVPFFSRLNLKNVKNASHLFYNCQNLKIKNFSKLNLGKLKNASYLFYNCKSLESVKFPTGTFSIKGLISKIKNKSLESVKSRTSTFSIKGLISKIKNKNSELIELPTSTFEIEDLTSMFEGCSNLKCIDFKNIYIKKIKKINSIFKNCDSLEKILHIKNLYTQEVEDISSMFYNCKNLKSVPFFSRLNLKNVKNASHLFYNCQNLKIKNFSKLNFENLEDASYLFYNCNIEKIKLPILKNFVNCSSMFEKCTLLKFIEFKGEKIEIVNAANMFFGCISLDNLDLLKYDTVCCKNMSYMFYNCNKLKNITNLNKLSSRSCKNMSGMFAECTSLKVVDLSNHYIHRYDCDCNFETKEVEDMSYMFVNCTSLEKIDLTYFITKRVKNMKSMFENCLNVREIDISSFNIQCVEDMSYMFYNCKNLEKLELCFKSNFYNVITLQNMFYNCEKLTNIDLEFLDFSKVTNMSKMFFNCYDLTLLKASINCNISMLQNKTGIFENCKKLNYNYLNITNDQNIIDQRLNMELLQSENNKNNKK